MRQYSVPVLIFVSLQLLFSCVGLPSRQGQPQLVPAEVGSKPNRYYKRNLSTKDIDYAIVNKDFAKAASVLSQLNDLQSLEREKYLSVIKEGFGDMFLETLDKDGIIAALPYHYSLQSLGEAEKYISESDFAEKLFDFYIVKEYFGAALNFAQTSLRNNIKLSGAVQNKFQDFVQKQFQNSSKNLSSNFWEQRIKGTVTIFVKLGTERVPYTQLYLPSTEIGSGFFIDNRGSIITNYHVISSQTGKHRNQGHIFVKLSARDELIPARLVGWDPNRDLALLSISRPAPYLLHINNTYNMLDSSHDRPPNPALAIGNELFAIGAPGGLENTLTSGRVSALGRDILPLTEAIQIDVPANPGNSGGPLLNKQGVIEGVVFAKNNSGFEGIAFAIPSDTLGSVLPRLYLGGKVKNNWLGILVDEHNNSEDYLEIRYVFPNSPAAEAQLQPGMRILSYRGSQYSRLKALQAQVSNSPAGAITQLQVQEPDSDKVRNIIMELQERPDKPMYRNLSQESTAQLFYAFFGAQLEVAPDKRNTYRVTYALPYSQVSQLNLHEGDHIRILQWLMDTEQNVIVAHISYSYKDDLEQRSKQSVLVEQLDLPNVL